MVVLNTTRRATLDNQKPMIDWNDYRHFLAVANSGSLSAAARHLKVAQPTVGRRIQALETQLQTSLFDRLPHGYVLTDAGREIVALAQEIEQQSLAIERRISGMDTLPAGKVCISTTEGLGNWLVRQLPAFNQQYPQLSIELAIATSMSNLLRREADIALRVGNPGSDELIGRSIGKVRIGLYAAERYLKAQGTPQSLADLANHQVIESTGDIGDLVQARFLRKHSPQTSALCCNNISLQLAAVHAGLGLAALPAYYVPPASTDLVRVLNQAFNLTLDLWLLTHRDLRQNAKVRAVMQFISTAALAADNSLVNSD